MNDEPLLIEISREGRTGCAFPGCGDKAREIKRFIPKEYLRRSRLNLPQVSEPGVVRHFTRLSRMNLSVDTNFYPLGSCTMKYNPKINEKLSGLSGFIDVHPYQDESTAQGLLEILYRTQEYLAEISGMESVSLQPSAGAHGEFTSMLMIRAYFKKKDEKRNVVLIPDSAHGTNPASCHYAGFKVVEIKSDERGLIDENDLDSKLDGRTACLMLTNPNTLGLFEENILEIAKKVHDKGALLYMDGANLNALIGITRPGDFGVDIMHFNLHKTFSTPHGGGGPGSGPVGVRDFLASYLPVPDVRKREGGYYLDCSRPDSIGRIRSFYGNVSVIIKAYCYLKILGREGLARVSENAVLNANYLMAKLRKYYELPYEGPCLHEFVVSARKFKKNDVKAMDIAKRLIDFSIHPPTVCFPLIVPEALMIEPTETESKETLDSFAGVMAKIAKEAEDNPEILKNAPTTAPVSRLDEVRAARKPVTKWQNGGA